MRIDILHQNIYGVGGTVRSVINLANALSVDHDVRITSVFRRVDTPTLGISSRVTLVPLIDVRPNGSDVGNPLHNERSRLVPPAEELFNQYSRLTDERLTRHLATTDADVVVGTRPALNLLLAASGRNDVVRVAQEHTTITMLDRSVIEQMRKSYDRIDLVTTVSWADKERVHQAVGIDSARVSVLPNGIPRPPRQSTVGETRIIVAGGRLAEQKRYDVLLRAFSSVSALHPDWRLRIYGDGPLGGALRKLAVELGVSHAVDFMGATSNMHMEWGKGEIGVCSSDYESFGMTIVESLRSGVPVVSTDCPDGPREILTDGEDGLLVPVGDSKALAEGISALIVDPERRREMGRAGLLTSTRYDPERVAQAFMEMIGATGVTFRRRLDKVLRVSPRRRRRNSGTVKFVDASRMAAGDPSVGVQVDGTASLLIAGDAAVLAGAFWKNGAGLRAPLGSGNVPEAAFDCATLDEGLWSLHTAVAGQDAAVRVRPSWISTRSLITGGVRDDQGWFTRAVPYTTISGHVGLRVWRRQRHAEVRSISADGVMFRGELQLLGTWDGSDSISFVARRPSGVGEIELGECAVNGQQASFEWPARLFSDERLLSREVWNIMICSKGSPVPAAFLATDVPDLRKIRVLPSLVIDESDGDGGSYFSGVSGVEVSARVGPQNSLQFTAVEI